MTNRDLPPGSTWIENRHLRLEHLPPDNAPWEAFESFASSFDGFGAFGPLCAEIAERGRPTNLSEMRACLFYEQRTWHQLGKSPDSEAMARLFRLIREIREKLASLPFPNAPAARALDFVGFLSPAELRDRITEIPRERGVYLVYCALETTPEFLPESPAGWWKEKDPTISTEELRRKWVSESHVVYIGKAGAANGKGTLRTRLKAYLKHGQGLPYPHSGGRSIWQIPRADSCLQICWKPTPLQEPRTVERNLIRDFVDMYGKLPFANRSK